MQDLKVCPFFSSQWTLFFQEIFFPFAVLKSYLTPLSTFILNGFHVFYIYPLAITKGLIFAAYALPYLSAIFFCVCYSE